MHHVAPIDAEPIGHKLVLARAVMDEKRIGIPALPERNCLPRADRDHTDTDARGVREDRQNVAEQTRLLGRGRRSQGDEPLLG
jgi:hypothetical protein